MFRPQVLDRGTHLFLRKVLTRNTAVSSVASAGLVTKLFFSAASVGLTIELSSVSIALDTTVFLSKFCIRNMPFFFLSDQCCAGNSCR